MAWEPLPGESTARPLQESLEVLERILGLARPDTVRLLESSWSQLVGAHLASRTSLESIRDGRMTVSAADPAAAEALRWQSRDLLAAARDLCGGDVAHEVVVKVRPRGADR